MHQCVEEREWIPVKRPKVEKPSWSEGNIVCENQAFESPFLLENENRSPIKLSPSMTNRRPEQVVRLAIYSSLSEPHTQTLHAPSDSLPDKSQEPSGFGINSASCEHDLEIRNQDSLHDNRHLRISHNDTRRFQGLTFVMEKLLSDAIQSRQAVHGSAVFIRVNRGK